MSEIDPNAIWAQAYDRLRGLESSHRLRVDTVCEVPETTEGARRIIDGQTLINFSSNDYLDLAHHPEVKKAAMEATNKYGSGCMASRLICGTLPIHCELEEELAELKGTESALVFSSGYMACLGVLQALALRADNSRVPMIFDRLCHASLIDGATQDRRNWRSFPHNDVASLQLLLEQNDVKAWPAAVVVTEGIFSMEGDFAPLRDLSDLCAKHQALLLVDDAHGTGVVGENGRGSAEVAGITDEPHVVQVGTLSKALGSQGGFVAGPKVLRDLMVNMARTFIFDTGLNPSAAGAALAAARILKNQPDRRQKLRQNILVFQSLLNRIGCDRDNPSPIVPVMMGEEEKSLNASATLRKDGFFVAPVRPPTVPTGTSRLRVTLSSAHTEEDIRRLARKIVLLETATS